MKLDLGREARAGDKNLGFLHKKVIVGDKVTSEKRCAEREKQEQGINILGARGAKCTRTSWARFKETLESNILGGIKRKELQGEDWLLC